MEGVAGGQDGLNIGGGGHLAEEVFDRKGKLLAYLELTSPVKRSVDCRKPSGDPE